MTFSEHLIAQRQLLNLTQAKAAELLGISKSALEKWEAGTKVPKMLTQEGAIARFEKAHRVGLH
jgi:DNA-binding transcriptional regulator YiaG